MLMLLAASVRQSPLAVRFLIRTKFPGELMGPHALIDTVPATAGFELSLVELAFARLGAGGIGASAWAGGFPASAKKLNVSNTINFKVRNDSSNMSFFLST